MSNYSSRKCLQLQRQKETDPDFQKRENESLRLLRNAYTKLDNSKLNELRRKEQMQQSLCRKQLLLKSKLTKIKSKSLKKTFKNLQRLYHIFHENKLLLDY